VCLMCDCLYRKAESCVSVERGVYLYYLLVADIAGEGKAGWAQLINNNLIYTVTIIEEDFRDPLHRYRDEIPSLGGRRGVGCFRDVVFGWGQQARTHERRKEKHTLNSEMCEKAKGEICFAKEGKEGRKCSMSWN
jgi:hypothetical protein